MAEKTTTLISHEWTKLFREMSDRDAKAILLALLDYDATGIEPVVEFDSEIINAIYEMMLEKTRKNRSLFFERCEKNAKNGALGGRPRKDEKAKKADRIGVDRIGVDRIGVDGSVIGVDGSLFTHTPSLAEVKDFCSSEGLTAMDPERFWQYYESQHWSVDGKPMDWKARARFWDSQDAEKKKPLKTSFNDFHQRDVDYKAIEQKLLAL